MCCYLRKGKAKCKKASNRAGINKKEGLTNRIQGQNKARKQKSQLAENSDRFARKWPQV